ncbi:alternative ribosome rescue aminoacyl-tRNA hydrolase ArfB [Crocinitomix catalasitica]|uniref:alternative ribosome rescue aminoacyl-tRNA hydrolase ArfB n=1 Tax=Crocinitomix catalasitica TaxID=184607 RepID=UPI000485201E|nr:alternative ribosome rescue aminoacyl-tRNA hydrolase ArfB [Crocinitomix catalasitica]
MDKELILNETVFKAVRSSGAGGQHVNKVASKVVLTFDVINSNGLSESEKRRLLKNLAPQLTNEGVLQLAAQESRSQFRNKALVTERLFAILTKNLIRPKVRRATKPTRGSKIKNAKNKARQSEKKNLRQKPGLE